MRMPDELFRGGPYSRRSEFLWNLIATQPNNGSWASFLAPENMPALAEILVTTATGWYDLALDYRPQSLAALETLIAKETATTAHFEDKGRINAGLRAIYYAAYLGEVICRSFNGSWICREPAEGGESSPILIRKGQDLHNLIDVLGYVRRHIDSPSGALTSYYSSLEQTSNPEPADRSPGGVEL